MLSSLLKSLDNPPDIWGEGSLFAFSGIDGNTDSASDYVATFLAIRYGLLFHTPKRRILTATLPEPSKLLIATGDVLGVATPMGDFLSCFSAWHTLCGTLPTSGTVQVAFADGEPASAQGMISVLRDGEQDCLVLAIQDRFFALAYGCDEAEARERAEIGLQVDIWKVASDRLAWYAKVPSTSNSELDRLGKKCASVMKVNTLSPEGAIHQIWSTPDRVPHRDMWLWDSVFHSWGMNRVYPALAWDFLKSVLALQNEDGMISHQMRPHGKNSNMTQPPILAWGVWENYQAYGQRACLEYALPRLEKYLNWDLINRDENGNGLLEWLIEENAKCRSGESGMDNSPRFDSALVLDAVDFSVLAALEMSYMARIAAELGNKESAEKWKARGADMSARIHRLMWDPKAGFYRDRKMDGSFSPVNSVSGFMPLLLGDIPEEYVNGLVGSLRDPGQFQSSFPVATIALSDPEWSTDMWRGATWINTNYFIILGLRKHGKKEEAEALKCKTVEIVRKYYEKYGVIFEFFDSKDLIPPIEVARKGPQEGVYDIRKKKDSIRDYHWSAALTALLIWE